ncbi:MAG: ferredoxin [Candidatus Woesearchaeota archaeon]
MAKFIVAVDAKTCIGCGACTVTCDNFSMQGDKAVPVKSEVDEIGTNQEAADSCPVSAITVKKKE